MIVSVFGTPSALTAWTAHVARTIVDAAVGPHIYVSAITLEDLRTALAEHDGRAVALYSEIPKSSLVDYVLGSRIPYLIAADDPVDVVGYVAAARELSLKDSLRVTSQSLSILARLRFGASALYLDGSAYAQPVDAFVATIIERFGINLAPSKFDDLCARLIGDKFNKNPTIIDLVLRDLPHARTPGGFAERYTADQQLIIDDTISGYGGLMVMPQSQTITWRPEVVPDRDNLERILDGPRDMLGPARILFGGHTLHLPAGAWKAKVILEIAENHSGNLLISQVYCGSDLLRSVSAKLPIKGVFGYEMEFEVEDSFPPIQVIIGIGEGAIEGKMGIHLITFDRQIRRLSSRTSPGDG
jgi:hypothetical protein